MSSTDAVAGRYCYRLNGELAPVDEQWCRQPGKDGSCRVTSSRRAGDVVIAIEAREMRGLVTAFSAEWRDAGDRALRVEYALHGQQLTVTRHDVDGVTMTTTTTTTTSTIGGGGSPLLFPLMRIFVGPVIEGLIGAGGAGTVVLPDIAVPAASPQWFEPNCSDRRAEVVAQEQLSDEAGELQSCRRCLYLGDQYDETASFWLAADGLLQRYQWRQPGQGLWQVDLVRNSQTR